MRSRQDPGPSDHRSEEPSPQPLAARLFRLALRCFPEAFRQRFGPAMESDFIEQRAEAHGNGTWAVFRTTVRAVTSTASAGVRERFRPSNARLGSPRRHVRSADRDKAHALELVVQDIRFAFRSLLRRPGFAAVAILTLALGIGANTAIFSVIDGVLLEPLEHSDPDGLLVLWQHDEDEPFERAVLSQPNIDDVASLGAFASMVGYRERSVTLTGMGDPELLPVGRVTAGLMETFGVRPVLGRDVYREENSPDAPYVAVIGYGFWQERFGGDPSVLGRTIELGGEAHQIIGVAPAGFDYPAGAQAWHAWRNDLEDCGRGCNTMWAIGRLAPGVGIEQARAELDALGPRLEQEYPDTNFQQRFRTVTLADDMTGDVRNGLLVLLGAVGVVLLIACANVANLLLVRGASRKGEVAVRAALGASRRRLGSQVLLESLVLAVIGGGFGLALAAGAIELLKGMSQGTVPRIDEVSLDPTVPLFAGATILAVAVLFGLSPAYHVSRAPVANVLARSGGRGRGRGTDARSRSVLLAAEVGLSMVLLVGAGLLLRTFAEMYRVELGYETEEILRFGLVLPASSYGELDEVAGFYRDLEERIAAIPGVAAVGSIFGAPLARAYVTGQILVAGRPDPAPADETYGALRPVTPGYLETMRIPVLRGRRLEDTDRDGSLPVALVNERVVRENFPGEDPIGQRLQVTVDLGFGSPELTIVGVVPDIRSQSITRGPAPEVYVSHAQFGAGFQTVAVRGQVGVQGLLGPIRSVIRAMDPNLPLRGVETVAEAVRREVAPTRFYLTLVGLFAGLALLLASIGLYGVVSYLVAQRTQEIGVRMALGAGTTGIARLVLLEGLRPALWGLALGLAASWGGARVVESLLFEVAPRDPVVFGGVPVVLLAIVILASLLPARRASRVDPVTALRAE